MCVSLIISKFKHCMFFNLFYLFGFFKITSMCFIGMFITIWWICGRSGKPGMFVSACHTFHTYCFTRRDFNCGLEIFESGLPVFSILILTFVGAVKGLSAFKTTTTQHPYFLLLLLEFCFHSYMFISRLESAVIGDVR